MTWQKSLRNLCKRNRTSSTKTISAVALRPAKSHKNSPTWQYLTLDTFEVINRDYGQSVPYSQSIIEHLTLASAEPKSKIFCKSYLQALKEKVEKKPRGRPRKTIQENANTAPNYDTDQSPPQLSPAEMPAPPEPTPVAAGGVEAELGGPSSATVTLQSPPMTAIVASDTVASECLAQEMVAVHPNGTTSYRSLRREKPTSKEDILYVQYTGVVRYEDLKDGCYLFASHTQARKALEQYGDAAMASLIEEVDGMLQRKVWTGVLWSSLSKTQRKRILRSSAFMKEKFDLRGNFLKIKARIVADGRGEDRSLYTESEVTSPTVSMSSLFTVASIAAAEGRSVMTMDVQQAYLNADMNKDVYIKLDTTIASVLVSRDPTFKQFMDDRGQIIVKLNKAQYGCIESAKLWYNTLSEKLISLGFEKNPFDDCVFNRTDTSGVQCTVCVYVDDLLATCIDESVLEWLARELEETFKAIKIVRGKKHEYLSMLFDFTHTGKVEITMENYTDNLMAEYDITTTADTPAASSLFDVEEALPSLSESERELFHRNVAQLLFLATRTRPDILLPVIFLTSRVQKATRQDAYKLKRVMRYLNSTRKLGINLGADEDGCLRVLCFADASYGVHPDGKSHSGIHISLGTGPVLVKCIKQKIVVKSSTEAELVTLSDATSLAAWQLMFLESLGLTFVPARMYQDNMSTMRLAANGRSQSDRTKHIKLRYFFVKQYLDSGEFELIHCPTDLMVADILTKPLQGAKFEKLRGLLLGYDKA